MIISNDGIEVKYKKIYELQSKRIGIPIFQRFYNWKPQQVVQLKSDILDIVNNKNSQLYLLDFIYYEEDNIIKIADGQQRLVTLNNLIKAIKDVSKEQSIEINDVDYFEISYDIYANDKKYKTHFYNFEIAPFKKVYIDLKNFVEQNLEIINEIIDIIKNKIFIYLKKCENADDAFEIFQQINTGGKPLTKDEVIKTALDQYSKSYNINLDTSKIKNIKQSLISYYKLKKSKTDKNFDNMEIITFLREDVTKNKNTFKDFVDTINLLNKQQENPFYYIFNYINRATLFDVLNILAMKKINIMGNKNYQNKLLIPLCMMSIFLSLRGGNPSIFRYLLNDVISMIKENKPLNEIEYYLIKKCNDDPMTWKLDFNEFVSKIGEINTQRSIKKALLILDVLYNNTSGYVNVNLINLEHIYPQNPDYEWARNGWPSHSGEQKKLIDNIGNYFLLSESINKSIQNKYITEKVSKYNQIIRKDQILQTPANIVDFEKFEKYREEYINERQKQIAEIIYEELPFGKVLIIDRK